MSEQLLHPRTKSGLFLSITFAWSLLFWGLTVLLGGINQSPGSILQYVGGAGPIIAALIVIHFFEPAPLRKDFWSRTFALTRIPWRWIAAALLVHPIIIFAAVVVDIAAGGTLQTQTANLTSPMAVISLVVSVFVLGPLPEEMGWRGVAYERIQQKLDPLKASLLLGTIWAAWHIPLFFIEGTFQNKLGAGSPRFWIFLLSNIPLTVIITWVYNHTQGSILSAAFVHFSGNIVGAIISKTDQLAFFELIGLVLVAFWITRRYGEALGPSTE